MIIEWEKYCVQVFKWFSIVFILGCAIATFYCKNLMSRKIVACIGVSFIGMLTFTQPLLIWISPPKENKEVKNYIGIALEKPLFSISVFLILFILLMAVVLLVKRQQGNISFSHDKKFLEKIREPWADCLRLFLALVVILIHTTCVVYRDYNNSDSQWLRYLIVNSATGFAVPTFFMLSGAFLLSQKNSIRQVWAGRIPKLLIPFLFWSVTYLLFNYLKAPLTYNFWRNLLLLPIEPLAGHLWFLYPMISLYILLPIISVTYNNLTTNGKMYFLILTLLIPCVFQQIYAMLYGNAAVPFFALGYPHLGQLLSGALLYSNREKLENKWYVPIGLLVVGLIGTILSTYYFSVREGDANVLMLTSGLPPVIYYFGVFCGVLWLAPRMHRWTEKTKRVVAYLSGLTFGVYLIHPLFIEIFSSVRIGPLLFTSNSGTIVQMTCGAVFYFVISLAAVQLVKQIPLLDKTV